MSVNIRTAWSPYSCVNGDYKSDQGGTTNQEARIGGLLSHAREKNRKDTHTPRENVKNFHISLGRPKAW